MKQLLGLFLFLPCLTHAVLPLPYSTDPPAEDPGEIVTVDPQSIPGFAELMSHGQMRAKELPVFGEQKDALGYEPHVSFTVPASLRQRVDFWKKIYTVYTSSQAIVHDAQNLDIDYGVLDLSGFTKKPEKDARRQRAAIGGYLKKVRADLVRQLKDLHTRQHKPKSIPIKSFALFRKFQNINDPEKFLKAAKNVRVQRGQRDKIVQGFLFGGRYWDKMMEIFEEQGVPKELTRLPLVESTFDLSARSKVGASGVWQFMRATGKRYLRIDRAIDERNDPLSATWAAAALLRQNYEGLESWPLAVTAYNHGREGMARAVRKLGTKDLAEIIQKYDAASFGFASSNFYSEFLAMLEVEHDYRKHFGTLMVDAPIEFEEVVLAKPALFSRLAERCGVKIEDLALLNPAFTALTLTDRTRVPARYAVKVPVGTRQACGTESADPTNEGHS